MIELQAVPRALSTAFGRCLNESGASSVFINEPFNAPRNDLDIAAAHIIESVEPMLLTARAPVVVVTKNMAFHLPPAVFRSWADVCSAVVWCIRDPRVQIPSLVTRTANDMLFGPGSDRLKQTDLLPWHLAMVTESLRNSAWSKDFSRTGWRAISANFTEYTRHQPIWVADASLLVNAPERLLRYLCSGVGLEFHDRMIDGWTRPFVNAYRRTYPGPADSADAWVEHAARSRGIERSQRAEIDAGLWPTALREHLEAVALPTYQMLTRAFKTQEKPVLPTATAEGNAPTNRVSAGVITSPFRATHVVPAGGVAYWPMPDPSSRSTGTLEAHLELQLLQRSGDWAEVRCHNGWLTWVDGRQLVPLEGHWRHDWPEADAQAPLVPNRGLLDQQLQRALTRQRLRGGLVVVSLIDLDHFSSINDSYGIAGGNQLLVELAHRLASTMTDGESVFRIGGDEFVVVSECGAAEQNSEPVELVAKRLLACVGQPFRIAGQVVRVSCSVGVAIGRGSETADELMRSAISARYEAKDSGRATYAVAAPHASRTTNWNAHFAHIYAHCAENYDAMVSAGDCDKNLASALERWVADTGPNVLEVGIGTGRITEMLCACGATVVGCEPVPAMLAIARRRLIAWSAQVKTFPSDCSGMPALNQCFDLAVAGWVFGNFPDSNGQDWRESIAMNIAKMDEGLKPGGALLLVESLGTGGSRPRPPRSELADYYAWLEGDYGFQRSVLQTDYLFPDSESAAQAMEFFFGTGFANTVRDRGWARVYEHTGIWSRRKDCRRGHFADKLP